VEEPDRPAAPARPDPAITTSSSLDRADQDRQWIEVQPLAEHYNCDDETVRQALKQAGVRMRAPWQRLN
jgi:hypothetical protein